MQIRPPLRLPEPADPLDPEISRAMVTDGLQIPPAEHFKGSLTEEEAKLEAGVRKILILMSAHAQWTDWSIQTLIDNHRMLRKLDAKVARMEVEEAKKQEQRIVWKLFRWAVLMIGAGALAALGQNLFK